MSTSRGHAEIPASDTELLRRAKRQETFVQLWKDDYSEKQVSRENRVFGLCVYLAREQRGYRDPEQVKRVAMQSDLVTDDIIHKFSDLVEQAIVRIDDYYSRNCISDLELRKLLTLPPPERHRAARKRGIEWPSTEEIQDRIEAAVFTVMKNRGLRLIVGPTAVGKTEIAVTTNWSDLDEITGGEPVILLVGTREAREEAVTRAKKAGLDVEVLHGYDEACPVAAGEYDEDVLIQEDSPSEWFEWEISKKGRSASIVHDEAKELLGGELPCCSDGDCTLKTQWDDVPRGEDDNPTADLIIATDPFANVPSIRDQTNIFHDEQPDYTVDFEQDRIKKMVSSHLESLGAPVDTWESFVHIARNSHDSDRAEEIETALRKPPAEGWLDREGVHTLTPYLIQALWKALKREPNRTGRSSATFEYISEPPYQTEDPIIDFKQLSVVVDAKNTVTRIRDVPDFSKCRSVVGLDAWPCTHLWDQNVGTEIATEHILTERGRRHWRIFERGLVVVQVGDATRPDTKGRRFDKQHAQILTDYLRVVYPERFRTAGTPNSIEDRFQRIMSDAGIEDMQTMHLGEQKSRNTFKNESVGLIYSCIDPGDDAVLDDLTECGLDARPEYRGYDIPCDKCSSVGDGGGCKRCICEKCSGTGCRDCYDTGHKRAHGRGFVGPNTKEAKELLASVREFNNAQMIGRWGRNKDIEETVVYSSTNALPEELVDIEVPGVVWRYAAKQAAVVEQLVEQEKATVREILEGIESTEDGVSGEIDSISRQGVWKTLCGGSRNLVEHGKVTRHEGEGPYGADVFEWQNNEILSLAGIADLGPRFL